MSELERLEKKYKRIFIASIIVAVITALDYISVDPIPFIDEAILSIITGYLAFKQQRLEKQIKKLKDNK